MYKRWLLYTTRCQETARLCLVYQVLFYSSVFKYRDKIEYRDYWLHNFAKLSIFQALDYFLHVYQKGLVTACVTRSRYLKHLLVFKNLTVTQTNCQMSLKRSWFYERLHFIGNCIHFIVI